MKQYMQIMFTSISHELRTPINAIQNSLHCMRSSVSTAGLIYLDICDSSSSFLLSLVNDTLDFAQLQAGKFKMNFETINVRKILAEVFQLINVQLRLKNNVFLV